MLTPQEVSTHAFSKAVMGGYNMAMVDEFLDELTDDYTALYKENAALKAKMKVLVEKVEDYRATEDSMRATLLTAQKMADSIVHEAEAKRDEILAQAESSAKEKIGQLRQEVEAAEERLRQGQQDLAQVRRRRPGAVRPGAEIPGAAAHPAGGGGGARGVPAGAGGDRAADRGEGDGRLRPAGAWRRKRPPLRSRRPRRRTTIRRGTPLPEDPVDEPTRRINLNDLKFGRNYTGGDD